MYSPYVPQFDYSYNKPFFAGSGSTDPKRNGSGSEEGSDTQVCLSSGIFPLFSSIYPFNNIKSFSGSGSLNDLQIISPSTKPSSGITFPSVYNSHHIIIFSGLGLMI